MTPKTNHNDSATKGDTAKLDFRMDKSDSVLETMAQQIDWLYKKELDKEEQSLIHDNRHVKVENFVTMITA